MSKDKVKKESRKEKKEKRSETDGIVKKSKKEKKHADVEATTAALNILESQKPGTVAIDADGDVIIGDAADVEAKAAPLIGALVPFANPLADEKQTKKIFKAVKRSSKQKTLKRGTKEVIKAIRKSPTSAPSSSFANPSGVVILAADISPMDVISHFPVLCEDHNIPYIYVTSRQQLGESSNTKRPTSVVYITKDRAAKKGEEGNEGEAEWKEHFVELVKLVEKATKGVRI